MVGVKSRKGHILAKRSKESPKKSSPSVPTPKVTPVVPKSAGQERFLDSIQHNEITICDGPAGSGKTLIAFGCSLQHYFKDEAIKKIVIVRPTVRAGDDDDLGYLPGDLNEKMSPFLAPIIKDSAPLLLKPEGYRNFNSKVRFDPYASILSRLDIEVVPLAFIRGRTFNNSFVILDEAQNCTMGDFKLFLTRIGRYSKVVVEGDSTQSDIDDSGLVRLMEKMQDIEGVSLVKLSSQDIIRNPLIAKILQRLDR